MTSGRPGPVLRRLMRLPVLVYGAGLGRLLGQRFLMLTHVGRKTGRQYQTVLEVVGRYPATGEYVVMAGFGHTADWLRNVSTGGARQVAVGSRRFRPVLRHLGEDEAAAVLEEYERRNRLIAPVVRRVLSRLVGWRYTGTDGERHRMVRELPLVAFGPAERATRSTTSGK